MDAVYYHAAVELRASGDVIRVAASTSSYAARAVASGNGWVDELLDGRPLAKGKPGRTTSVYCCPDIRCCAKFAECEPHLAAAFRIYEVVPCGLVHAAPMALVGRITRRKSRDAVAEQIADEYWKSTLPWRYIEVLAESLRVVGEVADWMATQAGGACFHDDVALAGRRGW